MERADFLDATDGALRRVYERDPELVGAKANERAIAHRLSVYLESAFVGLNVDCEYNKYGDDLRTKLLPGMEKCMEGKENDWIVPDVLIHDRKAADGLNVAVLEIKLGSRLDDCDKLKLEGMTSKNGPFGFDFALGIEFYKDHCDRLLFSNGKQEGEAIRLDMSQVESTGGASKEDDRGQSSVARARMEEQMSILAMEKEAKKRVERLSPETAVERYNYLSNKSITDLTEVEYQERLVLAERLSAILKDLRKKSKS